MKKIFAIAISLLAFVAVASAQPRALGLRIGGGSAFDAEVSYQQSVGANFVEADLGLYSHALSATGIYDFVFPLANSFNFYVGPGASLGLYNSVSDSGNTTVAFTLGVTGQVGIEYQFAAIPFNISLDWRPYFGVLNGVGFCHGAGLGFRYRF